MRKIIFCLCLITFATSPSFAQISEQKMLEYITEQASSGVDQTEIAKGLLKMGATPQQILALKEKYKNTNTGVGRSSGEVRPDGNLRVNNGERIDTALFSHFLSHYEGKRIFGHDIFRSKVLSFESGMNIPTPASYVLGAGDVVVLDIYGTSQISDSYTVSPEGSITISDYGPVFVGGMTVGEAQAKLARTVGVQYTGSKIKLSVGQTRSIYVNILGEVNVPGTYSIGAFSTVFNALYLAGGVNDIGTLRNVRVSRDGKVVAAIDVYDFIMNGQLGGNVMLKDNDVIVVGPYENLVLVEGKVKRPMYYELKPSETLEDALRMAGGFTGDAYRDKVRVERKSEDGISVHVVDRKEFSQFSPCDGDDIVVGEIVQRYKNTVAVEGAVFRPGKYKLGGNVRTVSDLIAQAGGLLENAVTSRSVLHRMKEDRTLETVSIDLGTAGNGEEIVLQNEDVLYIASTEVRDSSRVVTIEGEVFNPGPYAFSENETVEDLIIEAGGLKESASLFNVEIARRLDNPNDMEGGVIAEIFSYSLASDLRGEGDGLKLKPFDIVTIHNAPEYIEQTIVTIEGEVMYPGKYVISNKGERVSDILKRAGGVTSSAYLGGTQLTRQMSEEYRRVIEAKLKSAQSASDSLAVREEMKDGTYIVGVDMEKIISNPGGLCDVAIQEGDRIFIPKLNNTVKISGEVLHPNTVYYNEGKGISYYINQTGGVTKSGRRSGAYVVYADGQVSKASRASVKPGSEIVVPFKEKKDSNPQMTSLWLGMASTAASVAAVIASILR